nr:hypothetical protein [Tanacetum cinerariifolium]
TNPFSAAGPSNTTASPTHGQSSFKDASQPIDDPDMPELEDITYSDDDNDFGTEADFNNLEASIIVNPIPTTRIHKDHPVSQIIGDLSLTTQTRSMTRVLKDQEEPKRVHQALKDPSWIEAMQEELLQFKMQKVWILVDLPHGKRAIGHTQEEGNNYEEVFALVERIKDIRLFLAYASFMGFMVYQMDVKSAFLYGTIEEEVYVCQPSGFEDPDHPDKVYKVVKALYGLHQAPRAWYETLANYLLENDDIIFGAINKDLCKSFEKLMKDKYLMSSMGELTFFLGLQVKQKKDEIFINQDKYVAEILRRFGLTEGKSASTPIDTEKPLLKDPDGEDVYVHTYSLTYRKLASTPIDTEKPLLKDPDGEDVDVHTYKSMIGSLMYMTSLRPDIMFVVCACARFQVTPKALHLHVDALDSAAGGNFLDKIPRECLTIIESKLKVRYSRSRATDVRANANATLSSSSHSNSFDLQQIAAAFEDKLDICMNRFEKSLNEMKNSFVTPIAPLKAVTEKQDDFQNQMMQFMQNLYNKPSTSSSLPSNTIPNSKGKAKAITTRSGMTYKEPPIPPTGVNQQEPIEESEPRQEEIDVVSKIDDVLPPSNDDSDDEVDDGDLRVDNVIQNSEHEYSESEDSNLDNPLLPLPPPEPPDKEFDFEINFEKEILVERNLIVKFECIDARMKFDVENDVFNFIMFSLLFAESEDTIFVPVFYLVCACLCCDLSRIIPPMLKTSCVGYYPGFQDLRSWETVRTTSVIREPFCNNEACISYIELQNRTPNCDIDVGHKEVN